jgi:hypothetical protein
MQKGRQYSRESIDKMIETRKRTSNYGWTDERRTKQSERLKGVSFTLEHKERISRALKDKPFSKRHRKNLSIAKRNIVSNGPQHHAEISKNIEKFREDGFMCVRIDRRPLPDFIAIKDNRAFAIEVEGGHMNFKKYMNPHDYADIIWIQFRRNKNA